MQTTTKKVKEGKKGQKQIVAENQETLKFYKNMVLIATSIYFIGMIGFSSFTKVEIFWTIFSLVCYTGSYGFMRFIGRDMYSASGELIESAVDLNMQGGIAEHVKDLIILTSGCQVLSLYSNYFWLLWFLAPVRVLMLAWTYILKPYFFQEGPSQEELDKQMKKKKKKPKGRYKSNWVRLV